MADWFTDYGRDHQTRGNLICHYVGIPTIVVSLMGLLGQVKWLVPFGAGILELNLGQVLLLAGTAWYLTLAWQLAVAFFPVILAAYVIGQLLPLPVLWGLFAFGWILQFVGHGIFEKKKPAFFKNILQLLIGPFWIFKKFVDWVR